MHYQSWRPLNNYSIPTVAVFGHNISRFNTISWSRAPSDLFGARCWKYFLKARLKMFLNSLWINNHSKIEISHEINNHNVHKNLMLWFEILTVLSGSILTHADQLQSWRAHSDPYCPNISCSNLKLYILLSIKRTGAMSEVLCNIIIHHSEVYTINHDVL